MSGDCIVQEIKEALQGRPGQPIVFGVCRTIARRTGWEAWCVRVGVLICALFATFPTLLAYIAAGFLLPETETRTRGFFSGLGVLIREWIAKASEGLGRRFDSGDRPSRGY